MRSSHCCRAATNPDRPLCEQAEDALRNSGAIMKEALPMMPNVVTDRELITGQGPTSADRLGEALVKALDQSLGAVQGLAGA